MSFQKNVRDQGAAADREALAPKMRVLVTGHLGYLGPAVVSTLIVAGHHVTGLDSGLFASCSLEPGPATDWIRKDIRDVTVDDLRGFDAVVHLAALSNDPLGFLNPDLTHAVNSVATVRLARLARDAGVARFLNSSSCSAYGAPEEPWVDETSTPAPVTPYGVSKVTAEAGLSELATDNFCVACLRNATAFGYTSRLRADLVVNDFVTSAYLTGVIRLNSDGSAWRPLAHAYDIASAFALALAAPSEAINGTVFNVGAEEQNYTVREIAEAVAGAIPGATLSMPDRPSADRRSYRVRFGRVRELLPAFRCRFPLDEGIRDLLGNLQRVGFSSTVGFSRIEHLQELINEGQVDETLRFVDPEARTSGIEGETLETPRGDVPLAPVTASSGVAEDAAD
jgi:nucleoside-diphosphate-sugar epimerase